MRYITKTVIASSAVAVVIFGTTYAVEFARLQEIGRQWREAHSRGESWIGYCGPLPIHYATACGLAALVSAPVVLVAARGIWRFRGRRNSNESNAS